MDGGQPRTDATADTSRADTSRADATRNDAPLAPDAKGREGGPRGRLGLRCGTRLSRRLPAWGLSRMCVAGGQSCVVTLASGQNNPAALAVDQTDVYWVTEGTNDNSFKDGTVMKVPIGGGQSTTVAGNQDEPFAGLALDDLTVYWAEYDPASGGGLGDVVALCQARGDAVLRSSRA